MNTKELYIIPVSITGTLPPYYMPNEFAQATITINNHKVELLNITVQQRFDGPYSITASGIIVIATTDAQDAINSVTYASWCKLSELGVNAIIDDVNVNIGTGDILVVNTVNSSMKKVCPDAVIEIM